MADRLIVGWEAIAAFLGRSEGSARGDCGPLMEKGGYIIRRPVRGWRPRVCAWESQLLVFDAILRKKPLPPPEPEYLLIGWNAIGAGLGYKGPQKARELRPQLEQYNALIWIDVKGSPTPASFSGMLKAALIHIQGGRQAKRVSSGMNLLNHIFSSTYIEDRRIERRAARGG